MPIRHYWGKSLMILKNCVKLSIFFYVLYSVCSINSYAIERSKLASFVKKQDKCTMAVGMPTEGTETGDKKDYRTSVFCIINATVHPNTIQEKSGCSLMVYDTLTGDLGSPFMKSPSGRFIAEQPERSKGQLFPMIEGKDCGNGGFEELMQRWAGVIFNGTIGETLTAPGHDILYSSESKLEKYLKSHSEQFQTEAKKKRDLASEKENTQKAKNCMQTKKGLKCKKSKI